jgi:hypothetical protein
MLNLLSWISGSAKPWILIGSICLVALGGFLLGGRLEERNTLRVQQAFDQYRIEASERQLEEAALAARRLRELGDNQAKLIRQAEEREAELILASEDLIERLRKSQENSPLSRAVRDYVNSVRQLQEERDRL